MLLRGAHPSPDDSRDLVFPVAGAAPTKLTSIDATALHIQREQQQPNCVGYATWTAVQDLDLQNVALNRSVFVLQPDGSFATVRRSTLPGIPILSGQWGYTGARWLAAKMSGATLDPSVGLPNAGSSKRLNIMWGRDFDNGGGGRAESAWPDIPANATRLPSATADQADAFVAIGGYSRIRGEGSPATLRDGVWTALTGFLAGTCSKASILMEVGARYASTPLGAIYDDVAAANDTDLEWHDQIVGGYDADNDAVIFHSTWPGVPTFKVRINHLAALGGEAWVLHDLIYIPRRAA